jgi:AcrR family transcriptional regulator
MGKKLSKKQDPDTPMRPVHHKTLPQRRKDPKQARSQMLVQSIQQACRAILDEQGEQALSVNNLVEKAGIEIGSLYQYYPNIDAIVGEICREEVIKHLEEQIVAMSQMDGISPEEFLRHTVDTVIEFNRRLLHFDRKFFTQYKPHFRLSDHFNRLLRDPEAANRNYRRFLAASLPENNFDLAIFLIDNCLDSLIEKAILDHPEYLESKAFGHFIHTMCCSLLSTQQ